MKLGKIVKACRIDKPARFRLADHDPAETFGISTDSDSVKPILADGTAQLTEMQQRLYANGRWAVLIVLQGMDAAGKDGVIKHVMSGVNPQGCRVHAFKAPSGEELEHDFLWRAGKYLPERGRIGIFNRSHYEEVLTVRVNPGFLARQRLPHLPKDLDDLWEQRFESIVEAERHWARNGIVILKFWLNVSQKEQHRRFLDRIADPDDNWKFSAGDWSESQKWDQYMDAYEPMLRATAKPWAPWYAIPADNKPFMRRTVAGIIVKTLESLPLAFPQPSNEDLAAMQKIRDKLERE